MIKLFALDIDGCISMPFESPEWQAVSEIRELNFESKTNSFIPPLTICSGRPLPYVEAVAQWLGVYKPVIFESGGGIYDAEINELQWAPEFDKPAKEAVHQIRTYVQREIIDRVPGSMLEFTKQTDVGIIHKNEKTIIQIFENLSDFVKQHFPMMEVHRTEISVNCILSSANKGSGIKRLAGQLGLPLSEVAYIGDSSGDIPAMKEAGMAFSPSNASEAVKQNSLSMAGNAAEGVLEAYKYIIDENKKSEVRRS